MKYIFTTERQRTVHQQATNRKKKIIWNQANNKISKKKMKIKEKKNQVKNKTKTTKNEKKQVSICSI